MAEYIEFKIFEATQGGTKTSPDLSKEEVASVWQEADVDRRKTCDGRDWKLAGSKRTYAGVPDWSHHALRREGNRRVKKKNSQDRPEAPDLDQPLSYDDVTHDEIVGGESARFRRWLTSPRHRLEELPQSMMELGGRLKDSFSSGIQSFFSGPPNPGGAPPPPYKGFQIPRPIHP
ncbi:MAG: hypothetical protein M1815_001852 [Lichina confinis]|nr:MAG: hypothetical protein M1815_001852 [Lichina confinis]